MIIILLFLFNSHLFAQTTNKDKESIDDTVKIILDSLTEIAESVNKLEAEKKN